MSEMDVTRQTDRSIEININISKACVRDARETLRKYEAQVAFYQAEIDRRAVDEIPEREPYVGAAVLLVHDHKDDAALITPMVITECDTTEKYWVNGRLIGESGFGEPARHIRYSKSSRKTMGLSWRWPEDGR